MSNCTALLGLTFLILKMKIIIVSTLKGYEN